MSRRCDLIAILHDENKDREEGNKVRPRKVEVMKQEVYDDIDRFTYKYMDASGPDDPKRKNAISADTVERLDGNVIARLVNFRDAKLRRLIQFALIGIHDEYAVDIISLENDRYHYFMLLPETFDDNLLQPLAEYFHRFLVWGTLFDWYGLMGLDQANFYAAELDEVEREITDILRTPSVIKKPLQPFGPARKLL